MSLELINDELEKELKHKEIYEGISLLAQEKIIKKETVTSITGYTIINYKGFQLEGMYRLYSKDNETVYALIKQHSQLGYEIYELDFSNPELTRNIIANAYLLRSRKHQVSERGKGFLVVAIIFLILGIITFVSGTIEGVLISGFAVFLSLIYFGFAIVIKDIDKIQHSLNRKGRD